MTHDLDDDSPFARGLTIHVNPPATKNGRWIARVWRDGIQIAQSHDRNPLLALFGAVKIAAAAIETEIGDGLAAVARSELHRMIRRGLGIDGAPLIEDAVMGTCRRCGRVGPIGIAPCPCTFDPASGIH